MAASPLRQNNSPLMDKNYAKSPTLADPMGSPNKLSQPKLDVEPNQPLFGQNELAKSEIIKNQSGPASPGAEGGSTLLQTATRMRDQNLKLKDQLKQLKTTLRDTLIKVQIKNKIEEKVADGTLAKELDESQKEIFQYKKEIQALKNRLEAYHNKNKVVQMENLLKDKNRQIEDMSAEKRNLEKIKSTQDQELDRFQKEFGYEKKIQNFSDEAKQTREKIRKTLSMNRENERIFKQQQEYLVKISNQYRMVCDKLGIAPSMNFTRAEELSNIISKKQKEAKERQEEMASYKTTVASQHLAKSKSDKGKAKSEKDVKDPKEVKNLEPTQQNIDRLKASIESLKANTDAMEKNYIKEIAAAQAEKQEWLNKVKDLEARLKDKEKEASILGHRIGELKRIVRFNAVRPLNGDLSLKV